MHIKKIVISIVILVVIFLAIAEHFMIQAEWDKQVGALNGFIAAMSATIALIFIGIQLRGTQKLTKAQFINDLAKDIDNHSKMEISLEASGNLYEEQQALTMDQIGAINRLCNFFERVKLILDTDVLDMEQVDRMFAYRFFYLMHNPNVQRHVILHEEVEPYYKSLFELYTEWVDYRQQKSISIPRIDYSIEKYTS